MPSAATTISSVRPLRRILTKRWIFCIVGLAGIIVPTCYCLWMLFGWPTAIEISPETTWLTEPLTADGRYVDYVEAIRRRYPNEGAAKFEDDRWLQLTSPDDQLLQGRPKAAIQFLDPKHVLYASTSESDQERQARWARFDNRMRMPFTPTEDPEMAEMIRQNTPWYDAIAVVDPDRPAFYFPKLEEVDEWPLVFAIGMPSIQVHREIARRFALRAMLCFGSNEPDAGLANVRMIMAIAERERRSPNLISWDTSAAIDAIAHNALWAGVLSTNNASDSFLAAVRDLPVDNEFQEAIADHIGRFERLIMLDHLQVEHRTRCMSRNLALFRDPLNQWEAQWFCQRVDWNRAMRSHNETVDAFVDAFRIPGFPKRKAALQKITSERGARHAFNPAVEDVDSVKTLLLGDLTALVEAECFDSIAGEMWSSSSMLCRELNRRRTSHLAARFVTYRQQHGTYPETLDVLLHVQGLPAPPDGATTDAFSDEPFCYRREGEGFVLYSVGPNMADDSIGKKTPDYRLDQVWKWPLPPAS